MKKDQQFIKWFKAQFGGLPMRDAEYSKMLSRHYDLKKELHWIERKLDSNNVLTEMMKAAEYTKNAASSKKPFSF
jgi:hypothetical protein